MAAQEGEVSLKDLILNVKPYFNRLLNQKLKFFLINLLVLAITLSYLIFFIKPQYKSEIEILPDSKSPGSMLNNFSGIASLAGINLGTAASAKTIIYERIIYSESVLQPVIYSKYKSKFFNDSVNLIEYFKIEPAKDIDKKQQERLAFLKALRFLTKSTISTTLDKKTEILTLNVVTGEPLISSSIANNIMYALDKHLRTKTKTEASEQRSYLEIRNRQIKDSLSIAEEKLKRFSEQNRVLEQSPQLLLQQGRLMREVEIKQTVYSEITKQLELAKISEIQDTPVLNIKEMAGAPLIKENQNRLMKLIGVMFFSAIISAMYLVFRKIKLS